jgi:hypothetical protein
MGNEAVKDQFMCRRFLEFGSVALAAAAGVWRSIGRPSMQYHEMSW